MLDWFARQRFPVKVALAAIAVAVVMSALSFLSAILGLLKALVFLCVAVAIVRGGAVYLAPSGRRRIGNGRG